MSTTQDNSPTRDAKGVMLKMELAPQQRQMLVARLFESGLLSLVAFYTWTASFSATSLEAKTQALSLPGFLMSKLNLDPAALASPGLLIGLKAVLFAMLALWFTKHASRFIFVAAPIVFILMMSTVIETQYFAKHQTNFCAMAFAVLGAVRFFGASDAKKFSEMNPLPAWALMLLIFYIGMSYTYSGLGKIYYSGLSWGDGSSLMLWVDINATNRENFLFKLITENSWIAAALQSTTLIAETAAILMLFLPKFRVFLGALLVGFHISIEILFGFGFYANIFLDFYLLIVCYLVPAYRVTGVAFFRELISSRSDGMFAGGELAQASV